jgi:hypothetical protein
MLGFKRREYTVNKADPTQVTYWERKGRLNIQMREFWGNETIVQYKSKRWRFWNHPLFVRLFWALEGRFQENENKADPYYGDPSTYI